MCPGPVHREAVFIATLTQAGGHLRIPRKTAKQFMIDSKLLNFVLLNNLHLLAGKMSEYKRTNEDQGTLPETCHPPLTAVVLPSPH